ncbi:MAG: DUF4105 domain-containing protein [Bacteroidales bacterium]|nr:DUF4105 domain-containing protein [Bacteroidales bacterium]
MKKIVFAILFINQLCLANDSIQISILTCSPGQEVYSLFGHSSIRILDRTNQNDLVYNFGMFDFDTPNFSYKFVKGKLRYFLGVQKTNDFIESYTLEGRTVSEQTLLLAEIEKKQLLDTLHFLHKPENRFYYYSFLQKDCSTELRDLLVHVGVDFRKKELQESYRQMIASFLENKQWLRLGVNMVLGKSLDENANTYTSMFLPNNLEREVSFSTINRKAIVKSTQLLNAIPIYYNPRFEFQITPLFMFSVLSIILIFWLPKPLKLLICYAVGLIGLTIVFLILFSEHPEFKYNYNFLWCNPLYLLYIPSFIKNRARRILTLILTTCLTASIFIWIFKIQQFDIATIPIILILASINFREQKKLVSVV